MKFPTTEAELTLAGYKFLVQGRCNGRNCTAMIHWYRTPAGKNMPFSQAARVAEVNGRPLAPIAILLEPHFASCADVREFRKSSSP